MIDVKTYCIRQDDNLDRVKASQPQKHNMNIMSR